MLIAANLNSQPRQFSRKAASLAVVFAGFGTDQAETAPPVGLVTTSLRKGLGLIGIHVS